MGFAVPCKGSNSLDVTAPRRNTQMVAASYGTFMICAVTVYKFMSDGVSSLLTLSAGLQALAFLLLVVKVQGSSSSVSGISAKMLGMYVATLVLRLSSTLTLNGYLPADSTGDWAYQCEELLSLALAMWLFMQVLHVRRLSFEGHAQEDQDNMPWLQAIVIGCFIAGFFLHADLNHDVVFDQIWATACFMETAAMLPQLWMMGKAGGEVEALTSHFIALTALARIFSLWFWYLAFEDGMNTTAPGCMIIGAHALQLLLSCDFLILYAKSFGKRVPLGDAKNPIWI